MVRVANFENAIFAQLISLFVQTTALKTWDLRYNLYRIIPFFIVRKNIT